MARNSGNRSQSRSRQQGGQAGSQAQQSQGLDAPSQDDDRSAFSQLTDTVREHPKTALAAGAAVAAGVAAATLYGSRRSKKDD